MPQYPLESKILLRHKVKLKTDGTACNSVPQLQFITVSCSLYHFFPSAFSLSLGFVNNGVQIGVEEEKVVIFSTVLFSEAILVEVLQEIINSLDSS